MEIMIPRALPRSFTDSVLPVPAGPAEGLGQGDVTPQYTKVESLRRYVG